MEWNSDMPTSSLQLQQSPPWIIICSLLSAAAVTLLLLFITKFFYTRNNIMNNLAPTFSSTPSKLKEKSHRHDHNGPLPPGSYGWPIVGESLDFFRTCLDGCPERFVEDRVLKYQSKLVFKTCLFGERVAVLCGPAGNKFLFSNENKLVNVWWPVSVRRLLGPCLATSVGDEAKMMRRMLSYFLNPDALMRRYSQSIQTFTRRHINAHWHGKKEVIVYPTAKILTFELACRLFLSLEDPQHVAKLGTNFGIFLKGLISVNPLNIPGTRFNKALRATADIKKQLLTLVKHRKVGLQQGTASPHQDLLSHLLVAPDDNGDFLTEPAIVNNILMLLFAGHDTTASAITSLLKKLAELPHVYDQVFKEQSEIASSKAGRGGRVEGEGWLVEWEDIQKMKYSWNVVCEVMRLTPSGIGIFREALVDLNYAGYHIPKGWKLYWSAAFTHRDANWFGEPTKFDPSRFDHDDTGTGRQLPYSFVAFGGGARMCIGRELSKMFILTFLHHLVMEYRWELVVGDEKFKYDPTPIPLHGLPIALLPHHHD